MIREDFHTHTTFSDGANSSEEMVLAAIEKGMTSIGFSEHSYAPYDLDCCIPSEDIPKYRDEIARLKKKYEGIIDIYCGVEQDFFAPAPEESFDFMNIIIAC